MGSKAPQLPPKDTDVAGDLFPAAPSSQETPEPDRPPKVLKKPEPQPPPKKPQAPANVTVTEGSTVQKPVVTAPLPSPPPSNEIPLVVHYEPLTGNNQQQLAKFNRRIREMMMEAQKRKGTGRIWVSIGLTDGQCNRKTSVHAEWDELLDR